LAAISAKNRIIILNEPVLSLKSKAQETRGSCPQVACSNYTGGLFPEILVLVLLPMWYDCFNSCVRARSLGTAAQIKKKGEPLLVFTGLWFAICAIFFWLTSGKYKIVSWKKKSLKASKISLFFLRLYFVIL
jgi:hypothetical protein